MKCKKCNEEMEYFGSNYIIIDGIKRKRDFGVCTRHIPYTPVTKIKETKMDYEEVTLCDNCYCMTKTINGKCGKCKEDKK